jgi:hypothetical protein
MHGTLESLLVSYLLRNLRMTQLSIRFLNKKNYYGQECMTLDMYSLRSMILDVIVV